MTYLVILSLSKDIVMPAQAGIQPVFILESRLPSLILDSRLRGNDLNASS